MAGVEAAGEWSHNHGDVGRARARGSSSGGVRGEPERVLEALQPLRAEAGQASVDPALQQRDKRCGCQRCPAWR